VGLERGKLPRLSVPQIAKQKVEAFHPAAEGGFDRHFVQDAFNRLLPQAAYKSPAVLG
jgi:hypothetical protein